MKSTALILPILVASLAAQEPEPPKFAAEFQLKAKAHVERLMLAPAYHISIEGGTGTVKYTRDGRPQEDKGAVTMTVLNGIDPATKRPAQFSGFLRIEVSKSGWNRDKFVTRIDIPLEADQAQADSKPQFSQTATADMVWRDDLSNGITRYTDPMGVRMHAEYSVEVIKNPLK
jgi:hypothetical protein